MSQDLAQRPTRKPNPKCEDCDHPQSFHPRDLKTHRRKCKAFGCKCKNFVKPKTASSV